MIIYNIRSLRRVVAFGFVSLISIVGKSDASNEGVDLIRGASANVQLGNQPDSIVLKQSLMSNGSIEVRFRDTNHLRSIFEKIEKIDAKELLFIRDPAADAGAGLAYLKDEVVRSSSMQTGRHHSYNQAQTLIRYLDAFNPDILSLRTEDAKILLKERMQSRQKSPQMFPSFDDMCPNIYWSYCGNVEMTQVDYIYGFDMPLAYMASNLESLSQLLRDLPGSLKSIRYIDPELRNAGLYSIGPLSIKKKHVIKCDGDLALTGLISLPDHSLEIFAKDNLWLIACEILSGGSVDLNSREIAESSSLESTLKDFSESRALPRNMSPGIWNMLFKFWVAKGWVSIN